MKKILIVSVVMLSFIPEFSFGFDSYSGGGGLIDSFINNILLGSVGFVLGIAAVVLGAVAAIRSQILLAIPAIIGGTVLLKADTIVQALGALIAH